LRVDILATFGSVILTSEFSHHLNVSFMKILSRIDEMKTSLQKTFFFGFIEKYFVICILILIFILEG